MADYRIDPGIGQVTPALFIGEGCVVCGADAQVIRRWDAAPYCADDAELLKVYDDPGGVDVSPALYEKWGFHPPGATTYPPPV